MACSDGGLEEEIGALRSVLHRVLEEERDLQRLVSGVARVTTAIVQAQRLQLQMSEEDGFDEQ